MLEPATPSKLCLVRLHFNGNDSLQSGVSTLEGHTPSAESWLGRICQWNVSNIQCEATYFNGGLVLQWGREGGREWLSYSKSIMKKYHEKN